MFLSRQILIYRSVLSPVSPLYYKGVGQSPYPYNVEYIITQIGRGNKFSAENYVSRTVEDAGPYNFVNILMRTLLMGVFFIFTRRAWALLPPQERATSNALVFALDSLKG